MPVVEGKVVEEHTIASGSSFRGLVAVNVERVGVTVAHEVVELGGVD